MTDLCAQHGKITIAKQLTVYLCREGANLHDDWIEALQTHDPAIIYLAMVAYFTHRNGKGRGKGPCPVCSCYVEQK
jgi:hypothetical protein